MLDVHAASESNFLCPSCHITFWFHC